MAWGHGLREFTLDNMSEAIVHEPCGEVIEIEGSLLSDAVATANAHLGNCEPTVPGGRGGRES